MSEGKSNPPSLAIAYGMKKRFKKMAEGGEVEPEASPSDTPDGASTGGEGSGIGGAGTGGAATGGASTGGAGTVTLTINSGASSEKGKKSASGKETPMTINISNVGGKTDAGNVASGDGPGADGEVGEKKTKRQRAIEAFKS